MKLLTLLSALLISAALQAQVVVGSTSLSPTNPTNCSNTTATINLLLYCANYTYTGTTVSVSGTTVNVNINYTVGLICLPALTYTSVTVNLGQLPAGNVTLAISGYLNGNVSSSTNAFTTVTSCCNAVATFTPSSDTICIGESIAMTNSTTNANSYAWHIDSSFVTSSTSPTLTFDSAGYVPVSLIAYADTCNDTTTQFIQVHPPAAIDFGNDTTICEGDSLSLSVPSNLSNILWSNGSTALTNSFNSVGNHWASAVSPYGCPGSDTIEIIAINPYAIVDLGPDQTLCPGDSMTLSPGSNLDSYLWQNGDTTESIIIGNPGLYWVEATAAGFCPSRDSIIVTLNSITPIQFTEDVDKCGSNTIGTTVSYAAYLWSTGSTSPTVTFTDSTTAFLTITDQAGCGQEDSFNVVVWPVPNVQLGADTQVCAGQPLMLISNVQGTYLWSNGSAGSAIFVTNPGVYSLQVTNELGCTGADTIVVTQCVGIDELEGSFKIFPNPTSSAVSIISNNPHPSLWSLINLNGQVVLDGVLNQQQTLIDLDVLPSGAYLLRVVGSDGETWQTPILKQD